MSNAIDNRQLRANVRFLGETLGNIVRESEGEDLFQTVEKIRLCSKDSMASDTLDELYSLLQTLDDNTILSIASAFNQFLNLANIADQYHSVSSATKLHFSARATLDKAITDLRDTRTSEEITAALEALSIDLVLTAHPTEITRRTLIHKHREITRCLRQLDPPTSEDEEAGVRRRIAELVTQIWHTHEFRTDRPTPVDEARWGFAVIENSLWDAVPAFLRDVDHTCGVHGLPAPTAQWSPIQISSWIGGDRDGNPNVTASVTEEVLLLAQWQACDLFLQSVSALVEELSMTSCSAQLQRETGHAREPYRALLRPLRDTLRSQLDALDDAIANNTPAPTALTQSTLEDPLLACYASLNECGMQCIADGTLLDTIRRASCFGPHLIKLDIRQESSQHTQALSELTRALDIGDYADWDERRRCEFLRAELLNRRPLIPREWHPGAVASEVLRTFETIASTPREALGSYVISMASEPSDILAVQLLLKATGCPIDMPVAPLFETLADLDNAPRVIGELLEDDDYLRRTGAELVVMIGYSDSAKDAGMLAAGWAQYRAQEALLKVCEQHRVGLTLFHGRGGTIGRGGAPAQQALLSQPPHSLQNGLRVTEQGEMIRTKLGVKSLAINTFGQYASAVLRANLQPPPAPEPEWRRLMDRLGEDSCAAYRHWVREEPNFVSYFRQATPEQELASLPLGSRPSRRRSDGGIESLRAIPWIFAWSQNRLMLPAWLGAGSALQSAIDKGHLATLRTMATQWPFFAARLSMLEMVFAKADLSISELYDQMLVVDELKPIGNALRQALNEDCSTLLGLLEQETLLEHEPWGMESINLRNVYAYPLNLLQAELLRRVRETHDPAVEQALMVTIAGVAAGMRNTG
ncbi:phosphoenolpyruvate carboxylase [Luminiphilus syltensis NOR5-1B]|uniref:Phosphoenolpyruvate carboxylase n=1 Tax=Luminiphilus syltensis NOR5-1B TaxID=565045 RepID=B8KWX2_9GAMM|nr:phosphoenolpyruvate carboxylase [Luminiphilus syltensis]EED34819.1 phosphoenolpyruvate carboxylase [Luminiphilus syltensis NOR5-1B]